MEDVYVGPLVRRDKSKKILKMNLMKTHKILKYLLISTWTVKHLYDKKEVVYSHLTTQFPIHFQVVIL